MIASRGGRLWRRGAGDDRWRPLARIPMPPAERIATAFRLSRRLLRLGVHHVVRHRDRLVIMAGRRIHVYDPSRGSFLPASTPICGSRPIVLGEDGAGNLIYGEYHGRRQPPYDVPVHVWCSSDGGESWQAIGAFANVRHIHGVFHDPYEKGLWVTTGDADAESAIWVSHDRFKTVTPVIQGNQHARAVILLFTPRYIYYGTDTPLAQNFICRLERGSWTMEKMQEVSGSILYGCQTRAGLFFSTACEPSRVNHDARATVWGSAAGEAWRCLAAFRKDAWPYKLFQYGHVRFAQGQAAANRLHFSPVATTGDQRTFVLDNPF